MQPFRPGFSSARGRPLVIGSGVHALTWPATGTTVITQRSVNTSKNDNWQYQRRLP